MWIGQSIIKAIFGVIDPYRALLGSYEIETGCREIGFMAMYSRALLKFWMHSMAYCGLHVPTVPLRGLLCTPLVGCLVG